MSTGRHTDDTEMALILARHLLREGRVIPDELADDFMKGFTASRGYGFGMLKLMSLWKRGVPVDEAAGRIFPGGSWGNGAAMRVAPLAGHFALDEQHLVDQIEASARVTHTHPLGVDGAVAQGAAVAAAVRREDVVASAIRSVKTPEFADALARVQQSLRKALLTPEDVRRAFGNGIAALESVPAAIYIGATAAGFRETIEFAVRLGGDTDTVAAMSGAISGARLGPSAIPKSWVEELECRSELLTLADELWLHFP